MRPSSSIRSRCGSLGVSAIWSFYGIWAHDSWQGSCSRQCAQRGNRRRSIHVDAARAGMRDRSDKGDIVKTKQVLATLLIVIGLVSLLWGGISWTRKEKVLDLGPIEATKTERETIPMPPLVG